MRGVQVLTRLVVRRRPQSRMALDDRDYMRDRERARYNQWLRSRSGGRDAGPGHKDSVWSAIFYWLVIGLAVYWMVKHGMPRLRG